MERQYDKRSKILLRINPELKARLTRAAVADFDATRDKRFSFNAFVSASWRKWRSGTRGKPTNRRK